MKIFYIVCLFLMAQGLPAQEPKFAIGGQMFPVQTYQIVVQSEAPAEVLKAASEFQKYLERITGVKVPVVNDRSIRSSREIVIGRSNRHPTDGAFNTLDPDGFEIRVNYPTITITGGSHKGTLYGVYEFLESFLGCRFWAPGAEFVPETQVISLPLTDTVVNPAFPSREVYYAGMDEQDFTDKMRCDRHAWKGGEDWGLWVHTMFTLVPPETYFETHPEYYALMGGKRVKTQLCLTNPDVLKVTTGALNKKMKEKPDAKYWSVSQMDTYGSCECESCRAIDDREGSSSGSMISFVNQVAAEFPDKVISTLAYQYTRKAPKHIRPAPNVNIMLCTIECDRSTPLAWDTTKGSFSEDLRNWSAISGDILVWDYVIQFTNMIAPFPNLPVLQPNVQLFRKYGVRAVFEQGCHGTYSENQELRQYLLAKLLWNPAVNTDSLTQLFLEGYYGPAGPFIRQYLRRLEASLKNSGETLWIYGSPMQETDAFLTPGDVDACNMLFDAAEAATAQDTILLSRVEKARLPLRYAMIEISKKYITGPGGFMEQSDSAWKVRPAMMEKVNEFVRLADRHGVKTVHERSLPPDVYGAQTIEYFRKAYTEHLAKDKPYVLAEMPALKYQADGPGSLTDGKRGSANYYVLWQGFEGSDLSAVVDLGTSTRINYVGAEFLQDHASWIFYPVNVAISVSDDGNAYREVAAFESISYNDPLIIHEAGKRIMPVNARYVKFYARNTGKCPAWHIGHGGKAWLFADELIVDYRE